MSWDDGKHTKVNKVQLTFDDVIRSIEVEYEGTNLQSQRRGSAGTKSDGFTLSSDEYITNVSGYYKTTFSGDVITALTFKTNKKTYGPYGNKTSNYFSADAPSNNQIAGFLGTSGNALSSIDVHFAPIPPAGSIKPKPVDPGNNSGSGGTSKPDDSETNPGSGGTSKPVVPVKTGPLGGDKGNEFNDVGFDGVKKITVGADEYSVTYIKIEYVKDGKVVVREHGTIRGELKEFSVDYPNDNIVAVGGSYNHIYTYDTTLITSLYFTTSKGFTSPLFGKKTTKATDFNFKGENGGKLLGFHGRGGNAIDAIGAYFDTTGSQGGEGGDPSKGGSTTDGPGKKGPLGGDKGKEFNDVGFEGVKKIIVGADEYSVTYIKIEYVKEGKVEIREHGTSRGELKEFSVDYPKENITAVGGSYNHIFTYDTTLITSLYFTTSKGFTSPLFGKKTTKATDFEFKGENGGKLLGFHGRGGNAIDAIGAYFDTTGSQGGEGGDPSKGGSTTDGPGKKGPLGGDKGKEFNDVGFDGVKKITVGADEYSVTYIKIEYVKEGKVEIREHGTSRGELKEFSVDYPKENITAVGGSYNHIFTYDTTLITSMYFTTSKGFTSPLFGKKTTKATDFEFKGENGGKLLGFHGRGGNAIDAIGAYFDTTGSQGGEGGNPSKGGDPKPDVPGKKGPLGGDKGEEFNDVGFEGVKKITVGADDLSITYIKIEYLKDGKVETREHGTARGELKEFLVDYPKDNIVAVGGSYKHNYTYDTTLITSLYFTTSKGYTSPLFGKTTPKATDFEFKGDNGGKLLGFHGRGGNAIDAIGAYFDTGSKPVGPDSSDDSNSGSGSSTQKLDAQGGKGGNQWDDGGDQEGVTKIHVAVGRAIEQIRFDYIKNGQTKEGPAHGVKGARSSISTFEISHPDEYLLSVKGWSDPSNKIVGIQFITNTKTSDYYGYDKYPDDEGTDISLEVKDKKIVGFHGFAGTHLVSLGAYFAPIKSTPLKSSKKLKAVGGDEGASWDDGVFDNVKKIQVGQNNDGVCFVAIEYENDSQKVLGDGHGKKSALGVETFELTYPGEYITSVGVYYDKVQIESRGVTLVTCLKFKTNKQESDPFGMSGGEYAELKEEGHKIAGFHGKAGDWVHQIGVHVVPI